MEENAKHGRESLLGKPSAWDKRFFGLLQFLAYSRSARRRRTTMIYSEQATRCMICGEVHPIIHEFHFYYN
jgi:hypothetical protein